VMRPPSEDSMLGLNCVDAAFREYQVQWALERVGP
jgi:hypothetical protein